MVKLNAAGSALLYKDFFGGEAGYSIAIDPSGYAYVTGSSHGGIQPTPGAFQQNFGGAFVIKVKPDGSDLVYASYLGGGNGDEGGYGIAADSSGNAYVTGLTQSNNFPITPGAFQTTKHGIWNAYVTKVNSTGTALIYSTYLGGGFSDYGIDIVVDSSGSAYVTGQTGSGDFPLVAPFQATYGGGGSDAYVAKLNPTGTALIYSTYLGGSGDEIAWGIGFDSFGNVYVAGNTNAGDFPMVNPFQGTLSGSNDAFVAKISSDECGNGIVTGGEQCDDGNTINGDGCSALCKTEYLFGGFFPPVDNVPVVNLAKAGQAIPVKWRLTTANGTPITDPASFLNLSSATVPCGTFSGSTDEIETYTSTSGLQSLGNGYWQFNWATLKSYAGQCRILRLNLADQAGTLSSRTANFKFK